MLIGVPSRFALRYSPLGRPGGRIRSPSRFALRYSSLGRPGGRIRSPSRFALRYSSLGRPGGLMSSLAGVHIDANDITRRFAALNAANVLGSEIRQPLFRL